MQSLVFWVGAVLSLGHGGQPRTRCPERAVVASLRRWLGAGLEGTGHSVSGHS